jgi:hypothetical protein
VTMRPTVGGSEVVRRGDGGAASAIDDVQVVGGVEGTEKLTRRKTDGVVRRRKTARATHVRRKTLELLARGQRRRGWSVARWSDPSATAPRTRSAAP